MLSDVNLHSLVIEPRKPPVPQYSECSTMTVDVKVHTSGTDPMERRSVAVGTENDTEKPSADRVIIDKQVINVIESLLQESANSRHIIARLLPFHRNNLIQLQPIRSYAVPMLSTETLSVLSLSCGSANRVAILIGESEHDSWCSHMGKVIISQRNTCISIPLAVCPSSSAWSSNGVLTVGDVDGNIHVVTGDAVVSTSKVHSQCVSALSWISQTQLVSCGIDGHLVVSQIKGTSLENVKSKRLTVADLPRNIRKSSTSSRSLSIISMSMCGSEMCIATETGGIWIASLPDLHLKAVPTVPQAIQFVIYMAPLIAISGDDESTTLISCDGFFVDSFAIAAKYLCKPEDNLLVMADGTRTVIYDVAIKNIVLDEKRLGRAVNVSPQGDVVILSEEELVTLRLEKSSN